MASEVLDSIRERTDSHHERIESIMSERFFAVEEVEPGEFRRLLAAYFGLHRPLDGVLEPRVETELPDLGYVARSERVARDLRELGATDREIGGLPTMAEADVVSPDGAPELLGVLYVIEGAQLGTRQIRRALVSDLGGDLLGADSYFHDAPVQTRERWRSFCEVFERRLSPGRDFERAVGAARLTFEMYTEWFS